MKLYQFPSSPHCLKVRAVAYELGVRVELVTVNVFRRETEAPSFRVLNPNGLVPVLVDRDLVLWESNAILAYLATTHRTPCLLSTDVRERAHVDQWLHWESAHLAPAMARIAFERFVKPMSGHGVTNDTIVASTRQEFMRHCGVLEATLVDAEYIGRQLSIADFAVACVLNASEVVGLGLHAFPRTRAWLEAMLARDSLKRAVAEIRHSLDGWR